MIVVWEGSRSWGSIYEPDNQYGLRPNPTAFLWLGYFLLHIIRHQNQSWLGFTESWLRHSISMTTEDECLLWSGPSRNRVFSWNFKSPVPVEMQRSLPPQHHWCVTRGRIWLHPGHTGVLEFFLISALKLNQPRQILELLPPLHSCCSCLCSGFPASGAPEASIRHPSSCRNIFSRVVFPVLHFWNAADWREAGCGADTAQSSSEFEGKNNLSQ